MFKLPQEILRLIYEYDDSYKIIFDNVLQEINKTVLSNHLSKLDKYIFIMINDLINRISKNPKNKLFIDEIHFIKKDIEDYDYDTITLYEIYIKNVDFTFIKKNYDDSFYDETCLYKIKVEDNLYLYNITERCNSFLSLLKNLN